MTEVGSAPQTVPKIVMEDDIFPHLTSQVTGRDDTIKAIQKEAESFMIRAFPDFQQFWEVPDLEAYKNIDRAARGEIGKLVLGLNTPLIKMNILLPAKLLFTRQYLKAVAL